MCEESRSVWRLSSFPRGGNPALSLILRLWSKCFHSPFGRASHFLCLHKESKQRNAPQSIAPGARPALRVRISGRVPLTAHPCPDNGIGAIHRAAPAGLFVRCRRNAMGTREAKAARSCAQKPRQEQKRCTPLLLIRLVIYGSPFAAARTGRRCSKSRAHDAREFVARTGTCVNEPRPGLAYRRRRRGIRGVFSLVTFSCQARESNPRAGHARKGERTRHQIPKTQAAWHPCSLDSGIPCRNDK